MPVGMSRERAGDLTESERRRELLYQAFHAHGLNPENIFMLLTRLLDAEFPEEPGEDIEAKGRAFRRLVEASYPVGLEIKPADRLTAIVRDFRHPNEDPPRRHAETAEKMARMRARVLQLLPGRAAEAPGMYDRTIERNTHDGAPHSDTAQRVIRRLNRDNPELARQVAAGRISANKAAEEAGFRSKKRSVRMDNAESASRTLRSHMKPDVIAELVRKLTEKED